MKYLFQFLRILVFCLLGELLHFLLPLPIPASVYGLMLLLAALRFGVVKLEQVRTAALALKLAEREIHRETFGEYPVMLLDDVLSELDPLRQEYVLNRIAGGQVFITCCENDRLDALLNGRVFHVKNGEVL